MKKIKLVLIVVTVTICFFGIGSVKAASGSITSSTTNHAVTLSRTVTGVTNKVNVTFTYTISPDSSNPSGASGAPTSKTISFSNVTPTSGSATQTTTLDFAGMTFSKNGDYVYTVKETASNNATVYPVDSTNTYTVKFAVRNASATNFNTVVTILLYTGTGASATKKSDNTTFTFTKPAATKTITIKKTVEGNMADSNEYFAINLTVNGGSGDSYSITGQSKSGAATSITMNTASTPTGTQTIYLKHNETATISGVPVGATYSFVETGATSYNTYINGSSTNDKSSGSKTVGDTNTNTIKNTFNSDTLTGLANKVLPYVVMITLALAAIAFVVVFTVKHKKYETITD